MIYTSKEKSRVDNHLIGLAVAIIAAGTQAENDVAALRREFDELRKKVDEYDR